MENNCPKEFLANLTKDHIHANKLYTGLEPNGFSIIRYIKRTSKPIKEILGKHNVKTALKRFQAFFYSQLTLPTSKPSQLFPKRKNKVDTQQMKN